MGRKIKTELMEEMIIRSNGIVAHAARTLGIPTSTIYRRFIKEYGCSAAAWYTEYLQRTQKEKMLDTNLLISELQDRGYFVEKEAHSEDYEFKPKLKLFEGEVYRLGLISDTHLCSKYQQLTYLKTFYSMMEQRGINTVLHCGDLCDGNHIYKGHEYELFLHGAQEQIDYITRQYPEIKGIKTYYICGNHDESFYKRNGTDLGRVLSMQRKDLIHLGFHGAYIDIGRVKKMIYIHHGAGSISYARSYRQQKIIEQFNPSQKPYIHLLGHYHVINTLWSYRNVFSQLMPCFQSQTPYLKRKGVNPEVGGMVMEFRIVDDKPTLPKIELIPFYKHIEKDY